jgi:hypothetical protein
MSALEQIKIKRSYLENCTIGYLTYGDFNCFTLELPDLDNQTNISCIPEGTYEFKTRLSNKNGFVLELQDVEDRTYIQVHSGNFTSQIRGCILVGDSLKDINQDSIPDVTNSKNTLKKLLELVGDSGEIRIRG